MQPSGRGGGPTGLGCWCLLLLLPGHSLSLASAWAAQEGDRKETLPLSGKVNENEMDQLGSWEA